MSSLVVPYRLFIGEALDAPRGAGYLTSCSGPVMLSSILVFPPALGRGRSIHLCRSLKFDVHFTSHSACKTRSLLDVIIAAQSDKLLRLVLSIYVFEKAVPGNQLILAMPWWLREPIASVPQIVWRSSVVRASTLPLSVYYNRVVCQPR